MNPVGAFEREVSRSRDAWVQSMALTRSVWDDDVRHRFDAQIGDRQTRVLEESGEALRVLGRELVKALQLLRD